MKINAKNILTASLLLLATSTSVSLAATNGNKTPQSQTQQQKQAQKPDQQAARTAEVTYYDADPMKGGKAIKTETVQFERGSVTNPFAKAPSNAKFVVVKDDRGARVLDLSNLPDPTQVPQEGQGPRGGRGMGGPQGGMGGMQQGPGKGGMKGPQGDGPRGGMMGGPRGFQNADQVTFYDGDPLKGGKVTATFDSTGLKDQTKVDTAAKTAKFVVVEYDGHQNIIDLSKVPANR